MRECALIEILKEHKKRCQQIPGFKASDKICGGSRCIRDTSLCKTRTNNILTLPALKQSVYMMLDTPTHHYWQTRASIFKKLQDGSDMHMHKLK